jgi:hypothetical protein
MFCLSVGIEEKMGLRYFPIATKPHDMTNVEIA